MFIIKNTQVLLLTAIMVKQTERTIKKLVKCLSFVCSPNRLALYFFNNCRKNDEKCLNRLALYFFLFQGGIRKMSSSSSDELEERLNEAFDDIFEDTYNNIVEAQTNKKETCLYRTKP